MNTWLWVLKKLSALVLQITNKDLLNNTWNSSQCHVPAWMGGGSGGKWINVYMYMYGRVPLLFTQKYHNIVDRLYTPIQNKKFKIWKTGKKNTVSSKKKTKTKNHFCKIHRNCQRTCLNHLDTTCFHHSFSPNQRMRRKGKAHIQQLGPRMQHLPGSPQSISDLPAGISSHTGRWDSIKGSGWKWRDVDTKAGKGGWDELGDWGWHIYTIDTVHKTDN